MNNNSLHKDTRVLTHKGLEKISELSIGSKIWTIDGWSEVNKIEKKQLESVHILSEFGNEITCSKDSILRTLNSVVEINKSCVGDIILTNVGDGFFGKNKKIKTFECQ